MSVKCLLLVAVSVAWLSATHQAGAQDSGSLPINPAPAAAYPQVGNAPTVVSSPNYKLDAGTAVIDPNSPDEKLTVTLGANREVLEYDNLADIAVLQNGQELSSGKIKVMFQESSPVILVTDFDRLVPAELVDPSTALIYAPRAKFDEAAKKGPGNGKFRAVLDCVYADGKSRVEGMWKITKMRVNGVPVTDLKAVIDDNTVYFSRKHTKSEVHLFELEPGQYEVEFEAEATFEGKFFKQSVGRGAFTVAGRDAVGKVVFDKDR